MAGGLLDRAEAGSDDEPAVLEPVTAASGGGLSAKASAKTGTAPTADGAAPTRRRRSATVREGAPSAGIAGEASGPGLDGTSSGWLALFGVGLLVAMAAAWRVDVLTGWAMLAGVVVATFGGWRAWIHMSPPSVQWGVAQGEWWRVVAVFGVVVFLVAVPYFSNFSWNAGNLSIGGFEVDESGDALEIKYNLPGSIIGVNRDPITVEVLFDAIIVHTLTHTPDKDRGAVELPFSDFYRGNPELGEYEVRFTQSDQTIAQPVPTSLTRRTVTGLDATMEGDTEVETSTFRGAVLTVRVGTDTVGGIQGMASDYSVSVVIEYREPDRDSWETTYAYPLISVDGFAASWDGNAGGGTGNGAGTMFEDSGALNLPGGGTNQFGEAMVVADRFISGDGCYRLSLRLTHEAPFGTDGRDVIDTTSTETYRYTEDKGYWKTATDC